MDQCLEALSFKAMEKGISLSYSADDVHSFDNLYTDAVRVKQILINLISNAIKYTPRGSVKVSARVKDEKADMIEILVADTGVGMSEDQMLKLFTPFTKILSNRKLNAEGVGLGLAVSKNIALALGGDITAESVLGKGSIFTLTIPYKIAPPIVETLASGHIEAFRRT